MMKSIVSGLGLNEYKVSFSFFIDSWVKIFSFFGFLLAGFLSVYLFKKRARVVSCSDD